MDIFEIMIAKLKMVSVLFLQIKQKIKHRFQFI